ncbi:hypothetical protein [Thermoflavimicrobium dichotomicum]|uniref:ABC-2 type transport system permease protein n=1 Tax=Thermoflavimicrobium dichotomicum TaxID=46223 RepID=A0A1I3TW01_9BACL|nr:hypothetical protein [Thermoflavimicrobium dichotomicum]SFJ73717.1 hypothetical protein SAMN05421852_11958 [Thermoflavimicrobium dichotomicum]
MTAFWSMVKKDYQMIFPKKYTLYAIAVLLFSISFGFLYLFSTVTQVPNATQIHWMYTWLLFALPGFSSALIYYEWNHKTMGWWLSSPYPHWWLIATKCTAMFLRTLQILSLIFIILNVNIYLFTLIKPNILGNMSWEVLILNQLKLMGEYLLYAPYLITLGIFGGVLNFSYIKFVSIPVWFLFGITSPFFIFRRIATMAKLNWDILDTSLWIIGSISLLLTFIFFAGSIYTIKNKMEI